jgi:hypothetical protein
MPFIDALFMISACLSFIANVILLGIFLIRTLSGSDNLGQRLPSEGEEV